MSTELSEVSDDELLSQSEGEIELSEKSDQSNSEEDFDDENKSINSDSESNITDSDEEEPWILPDDDEKIKLTDDLTGLDQNTVELSDSDSDNENEVIDEDELKKFEKANKNDILSNYHPEMQQINYKELQTLCKITKDKHGLIIDPLHQTIPILTRYEKAKILGLRAKQINEGSNIFVEVNKNIIDGHLIAEMELKQKKIPFIIRRPLPNGSSEYWRISDLEVLV